MAYCWVTWAFSILFLPPSSLLIFVKSAVHAEGVEGHCQLQLGNVASLLFNILERLVRQEMEKFTESPIPQLKPPPTFLISQLKSTLGWTLETKIQNQVPTLIFGVVEPQMVLHMHHKCFFSF